LLKKKISDAPIVVIRQGRTKPKNKVVVSFISLLH
jgi:hypothetical protein